MPQPLPAKERSLFQQVVKNYESKQYKKGIKAADQILRKVPDHGDTLAMKALILNSQNQTDEAFTLAKLGLKNDMKSHVCWHVYGLLYRSAKNFEESIKAYKMALRIEPESKQIQRDLAMLQVQMRDYSGYSQSRQTMLQSGPGWRANWTALAIAQHLDGDLEGAEKTLNTYEETLKTTPPRSDVEHQEAVMYKNTIIADTGNYERALEHLNAATKRVPDQQSVLEFRAKYLLKLERNQEAENVYRQLLARNAEYRPYYAGLENALGLKPADIEKRKSLYAEYAEKNKRGDAARRIPLDFLEGPEFKEAADAYLQRMLKRGVPSTFANVKALYSDHYKRSTFEQLLEQYKTAPTGDQTFDNSVLYYLTQHYNYHITRDLTKAEAAVDALLQRNDKSVDYQMAKARILKHRGDLKQASTTMEHARSLDEKDRYINTKAAKYQLRNDENDAALKNMSKFTKPDAVGGPLGDLLEMQSIWFLTEDGESRMRQNQLGLALKRFHAVYNIYDVWQEDQFDFHSFSLRKGQIRAYMDMIKWEDQLRRHPYYTRAALGAIKTYIRLSDRPDLAKGPNTNGNIESSEQKKAAKKARKEAEKQAQLEHEKNDAKKAAGGETETKKVDLDPDGKDLVNTKQPLEDAVKFLSPLMELNLDDIEAAQTGFELCLRRSKWLPAFRCLSVAFEHYPEHPFIHKGSVKLRSAMSRATVEIPAAVLQTIEARGKAFLPSSGQDLAALNDEFLASNKSFQHQLAGADVLQYLDRSSVGISVKQLISALTTSTPSLEEVTMGLDFIEQWQGQTKDYIEAAHGKWPDAKAFQP